MAFLSAQYRFVGQMGHEFGTALGVIMKGRKAPKRKRQVK
jgi:hypothetical protein